MNYTTQSNPLLSTSNRPPLAHWLAWLLFGVVCVSINRYTNWDLLITDYFFSAEAHVFPLKENPFLQHVFHDGLRLLSGAGWLGMLLGACRPGLEKPIRMALIQVLVISLLAACLVTWIKSRSIHSCPWDLAMFGGTADYSRLFESFANPATAGPGKCFPSGHASSAFMWVILLYSPLPWLTQHRKRIGCLLLILAVLAGGVQIIRGAHFLSHVLATAWVCWGITLLLVSALAFKRPAQSPQEFHR